MISTIMADKVVQIMVDGASLNDSPQALKGLWVPLQREALSLCSRLFGLLALTEVRVKLEVLRYRWAFKRRGA
jgi:hypothetical protein